MPAHVTPYVRLKVMNADGSPKKRDGRQVYRFHGANEYAGKGVWLRLGWNINVHMPEGFESDGPSRPTPKSKGIFQKLVGVLLIPVPQALWQTAVLSSGFHDVLCEHPDVPRPVADGMFWACMHVEKTPAVWRDLLFRAVTFNSSKEAHNDPTIFDPIEPDLFSPRPGGVSDAKPG